MKILLSYIKMVKEIITIDDIEIERQKFHLYKTPIL